MSKKNIQNSIVEVNKREEDFISVSKNIDSLETIQELLNTLPLAAAILDTTRNVLFVNNFLKNNLGIESVEILFGKKLGEVLGCLHTLENSNCEVSESCRLCGIFLAMNNALSTKKTAYSEMRLTAIQRGLNVVRDFKVTVSPIFIDEKTYLILYINDISHEKRRHALERIFFHDVLNKATNLKGITELFKATSKNSFFKTINSYSFL